jgi:hypothetical protein
MANYDHESLIRYDGIMESITRLDDIKAYNVSYKPQGNRPALWDCPKVIREAAFGSSPKPRLWSPKDFFRLALPVLGLLAAADVFLGFLLIPATRSLFAVAIPAIISLPLLLVWSWRGHRKDYERDKEIFDAFRSHPDLYRDEVFKAAVDRLPLLDFHGRHLTPVDNAKIGRYEQDVIGLLGKLGIRQEYTVANRGRPYLIHQYELRELGWGKRPDGSSKNYVPDVAILWPERRIKFNLEVDDPTHDDLERYRQDIQRDGTLTERGWFVRRLKHRFIADGMQNGKLDKALTEVLQIIYFFAKYANDQPLEWDSRFTAWLSQRRHHMVKVQEKKAHGTEVAASTK